MNTINGQGLPFRHETIADAIHIWNNAAISLMDIRHYLVSPEEAIRGYRLPASTFLYTSGGKAEVSFNGTFYNVERFGLFHGGKGTELTITLHCDWLEYYMVLYRVGDPPFHSKEYAKRLEKVNPFRQQYGFMPDNPVFFSEQLRKMYEKWKGPTSLNLFYGKATFYQLVHEIYEEIIRGSIHVFEPDIIAMARRYLDENYSKDIVIQELCGMLGISYSHFHRRFKQQTGRSPQEYLIKTRLSAASELLKSSGASIREVADYCGFQDERNFHRLFVKTIGLSPNAYRENTPAYMRGDTLGNLIPFPYNKEVQVRLDELKGKGDRYMFKQMRSKAVMAAALSLMLLLSACGTALATTSVTASAPTSMVTSQVTETEATEPVEEGTRTISTVMGDVQVPANPKSVVVSQFQGDLLALEIGPVGTSFNDGAIFEETLSNVTVIDAWDPNYEEIAELEPDLIIWIAKDNYEKLSQIAPTVIMPYYEWDYEKRLRFFGDLLNKSIEAEAVISAFNQKLENAKAALSEAGILDNTISLFEVRSDGTMRVFGDDYGRGGEIIYRLLEFSAPDRIQNEVLDAEGVSFIDISFEMLSDYAGYYIFSNDQVEVMNGNAVWDSIPAVKNHRLIQVETGMFWFSDIQSFNAQLDTITNALLHIADNSY